MGKRDKRVDQFIANSAEFARPILEHLRELIHKACPDVEESIKWGMPNFGYHGMLCGIAAFKKHCAISFFKASLMSDKSLLANAKSESAMGHLGQIRSLKDLPSDRRMIALIKEAAKINQEGLKVRRKKAISPEEIVIPDYFKKYLSANEKAKSVFEKFSPSHKREYLEWITEAKTETTRVRRMETAIEWLEEEKPRNWKYMKKK